MIFLLKIICFLIKKLEEKKSTGLVIYTQCTMQLSKLKKINFHNPLDNDK